MATRTNAHEERLATLRSVMNVISILDQQSPRRVSANRGIDLRPLLPALGFAESDESWDEFWAVSRNSPITSDRAQH